MTLEFSDILKIKPKSNLESKMQICNSLIQTHNAPEQLTRATNLPEIFDSILQATLKIKTKLSKQKLTPKQYLSKAEEAASKIIKTSKSYKNIEQESIRSSQERKENEDALNYLETQGTILASCFARTYAQHYINQNFTKQFKSLLKNQKLPTDDISYALIYWSQITPPNPQTHDTAMTYIQNYIIQEEPTNSQSETETAKKQINEIEKFYKQQVTINIPELTF